MQEELEPEDWERMLAARRGCVGDTAPTDKAAFARYQLFRFLQLTELTHFVPPVRTDAASFYVASEDQYVPRGTVVDYWEVWALQLCLSVSHRRLTLSFARLFDVNGVTMSTFVGCEVAMYPARCSLRLNTQWRWWNLSKNSCSHSNSP